MIVLNSGKVLRPNHTSIYPSRCLFLDTETTQATAGRETRHSFLMGWTRFFVLTGGEQITQDKWTFWTDPADLCRYMEDKVTAKKALWIFGHNIYFDLQVAHFFYHFPRNGWQLDFIYDSGLTYILIIKKDKRTIKIISTTNYFDYSLSVLGDEVGLPKKKVIFGESTASELKNYCHRDVEITVESVLKYMRFQKEHDTGRFGMTKASQAMNAYRHRFMPTAIHLHREESIIDLERKAYFGGRTEAYRMGRVPGKGFTFLDINSMYPHVMREFRYPKQILMYYEEPDERILARWLESTCMVAEVEIDTPDPIYALRRGSKVVFPIGRFKTFLCTRGIETAIKRNHLLKIHRLAVYEPAYLFRGYVDYWYPLKAHYKETGNDVYRSLVKKMLNSLYGKFGEKKPIEEIVDEPYPLEPYRMENFDLTTGKRWIETHLFGKTISCYGWEEGNRSFPAVAAHVCEYGRLLLWDIIESIGTDKVYYCDTDSVAIDTDTVEKVQFPIGQGAIGSLSIDKVCDTLRIYGAKDYSVDGDRRTKGVPKKAVEIRAHTYEYEQFMGSLSHLRRGETRDFITNKVTKVVTPHYDKGVILPGGQIVPHLLGETG